MFRISYIKIEGTDLYKVKLFAINQTIVLNRHHLVARIGMDPRVIVGCKDLTVHEIMVLGFIVPVEIAKKID